MEHAITSEIITTSLGMRTPLCISMKTEIFPPKNASTACLVRSSSRKSIDFVGFCLDRKLQWYIHVQSVRKNVHFLRFALFWEVHRWAGVCTKLDALEDQTFAVINLANNCENSQQTPVATVLQYVWIWAQSFWIFRSQNRNFSDPKIETNRGRTFCLAFCRKRRGD